MTAPATTKISRLMTAAAAVPLLFSIGLAAPDHAAAHDGKDQPAAAQKKPEYAQTLKLEFTHEDGTKTEVHFGLTADVYQKAQEWLASKDGKADTVEFSDWLSRNGGQSHRAGGLPAVIMTHPDGGRYEEYWENGKLIRAQSVADLSKIPGVTITPPQP